MKVITLKLRIDDGEAIKSIDDLGDGLANLDQTAARQAADSLENLFIKADLKARAIVALTDAVRESFTEFRNFGKEVANLDTLLEGEGQIQSLKKGLLELNPNLGQTSELARGMYQALSSGVEAGEALQFIEKSAKAARAGLATTFETVDAGTSVMASFGLKGQEIGEIYDKMFETVKRGKVEMSQLSQSLGLVTNIAAQAGVTIDEMFGAISTSTRTMRPSSAIEGFRSALSNIIKPAKEASELAEQLGIQFDSTALKTKGFAQFLNDVTKATNGNQQQMATLFGDVQALAFVMSVTGNQANQLAEDIKGVATASGTVDEAFKKQQQSLDAQITTFKNSVLQGFTKVFTEIEPILSGSLRLLNEYPIAVASVVTALGLLVAAYNAVTIAAGISGAIQSISSFGSSLGGTIFVIQNVVRAMLGLQTAFITTGEVAVAATGGWLALIAGVGAVIYAIVQYSQAQQKTTEEQLKSVQASKGQVDTLNQQQKVLSDLQNGVGDLSNRQQQLTDIYGTLNGASLDRVNAATKEKGAVGALADEVERLNKAKGIELEIKVIDLVGRAAKAYEDQKLAVNRAEDATKTYQNAVGNLTPVMEVNAKTGLETGRVLMTVKEQYDQLGVRQNQTSAEAETAKNAFNELKAALDTAARSMGMTTAEFINAKVATGQLDKQSAEFLQTLSNTGNAQDNFANRTQNATDTINQQTAAVKSLRDQLKGLITDTQARVDDKIASIAIGAKDKAEAKKQAESLRKTDTDFKKDLDEIKRLKDNEKAIRDVLQPSEVSSTKKLKAPNPAADFRRENRIFSGNAQWDKYVYEAANKYGIDPMLIFAQMNQESSFKKTAMSNKGASGLMQLMPKTARELGVKNIFDPKENIFAGVKYLRDQLKTFNGNVALGLAAYNAGPGAVIKYGGIPPYKETQEYVKRISDKYQKLKGGKFEMGAGFDYEKSIGELSDKRTKDYRESQTLQAIDFARMTGNAPDADVLRDYHRLKVDEAKRRGDIQPEFEDIAKEFKKYQTLGTEVTTRTTLANKRDQRFSDLRDSLDLNKRHKDLDERRLYLADEINIRAEDYRLGLQEQLTETQVEAALLAKRNIAIETSVEFEKQRNAQVREIGDIERDLGVLRAQNANAEFVNERRNLAASREKYSLERQITDLQDELANQGVNDDLKIQLAYLQDVVSLRNRELDAVIAINRAELEMSKSMEISNNQIRARVYEHLAQQKTLNEAIADGIIGTYEAVADQAGKALDRLNEKTKGFLSFIIEPAKAIQRNILSNITKNIIDTVFPGMGDELTKTSNPIARPIVDEQKKTNKILERIANVFGAGKGVSGLGSLGIPGIGGSGGTGGFGTIFGGNAGGGIFNFGGAGNQGLRTGDIVDGAMQIFAGDKGRDNLLSNLKYFFSGKQGGIFGKEGFGNNNGTYGLIGMAANLLGGAIGGKVGGFISGAGSGLAMGASIGTMIMPGIGTAVGAAIGAIAGGLMSLFGGDPKRKKDKNENLPKLQQGMADSFKEFQQLVEDLKFLRINGEGAITKARELRTQIANGFGVQFESKKYRQEGQKIIAAKLSEIDRRNEQDPTQGGLMQQVEYYADLAKNAENRNKRMVAEFATGVYMDRAFMSQYGDYKRKNGMLPGTFTGKDTIRALIAEGEMVLNPEQIRQVIQNARRSQDDPFKGANIPGYANGVYVAPSSKPTSPQSSAGLFSSQPIIVDAHFTLYVEEGMTFDERTKVYLESDSGKRVQVDVQRSLKKEGKI